MFELVHCTADRDWGNDFLCVKNSLFNFTKSTQDVRNCNAEEFLTDLLETVLLESPEVDASRNNMFLDAGFCSDRNSSRDGSPSDGVARPRLLKATTSIPLLKDAMVWMSHVCSNNLFFGSTSCSKRIYASDPVRHKEFAASIHPNNDIESLRVAVTNQLQGLCCHVDRHNDTHPDFALTYGVVKYVYCNNQWYRVALIAYSRASIGRSLERSKRFGTIVKEVNSFYKDILSQSGNQFRNSVFDMAVFHQKMFAAVHSDKVQANTNLYLPSTEEKDWLPHCTNTL